MQDLIRVEKPRVLQSEPTLEITQQDTVGRQLGL